VAGITPIVGQYFGPGDVVLGYLPAAHIFEFMFENASFFWGSAVGFGNAKTLSDVSTRNCKGDIRELRPTILIGVPAIWEGIRKGVVAKINEASPLLRSVFWAAYNTKSWLVDHNLSQLVFFDSIFNKVRDATGGRLRIICNGAGPISHSTQRFLSLTIQPMLSGYGLTEATAMGALTSPMRWNDQGGGDIPASVEIKLVDFPEANYFTSPTEGDTKLPQGEIWVRGHSIAKGYYNDPEETERGFIDGWFRTGDIGEFTATGHLRVIDRMKNLVKTMNGEYIALEKLESNYRTAPFVFSICVYASNDQSRPVAVIVPAEPALVELAKANNIPIPANLADLRDDPKLNAIALNEIIAFGKKGGLSGIEIIVGLVIVHDEWTPQTGFLTSAMKLKRRVIVEHYKKEIDQAYGKK
jgi:long-chain acyl-CoA synthetase